MKFYLESEVLSPSPVAAQGQWMRPPRSCGNGSHVLSGGAYGGDEVGATEASFAHTHWDETSTFLTLIMLLILLLKKSRWDSNKLPGIYLQVHFHM